MFHHSDQTTPRDRPIDDHVASRSMVSAIEPETTNVGLWVLGAIITLTSLLLIALPTAAFADVSASPSAPPGAAALQDLLNWTLYGGAIACTATAMFGFAKMGISHTQQCFQGANHGKSIAILGLLGALGLGLTPTIVNALTAIH